MKPGAKPTFTLSPQRRAWLDKMLQQTAGAPGAASASTRIPRQPRTGPLPLSFAQQRLWFIEQLTPGTAVYHIPLAVRFSGALDLAALARSFSALVERHEMLRTTFPAERGQPVQQIAPTLELPLATLDLSALPAAQRTAQTQQRLRTETQTIFDLARGPLWRARLIRLSDDDHVLIVTLHHIISDAWSMGVLIQELATLYEAFSAGQPSPLPELPIQYVDFACWQREWLAQGDELETQLAYWKRQLAGRLPVLELPTDHPRPAGQSLRGARQPVVFSPAHSDVFQSLCQHERITLFMLMLASFDVLLARYTGQTDILIGSPIANRNRVDTVGLIGFFVNTLVLRSDLSGNPTYRTLLARVRDAAIGAYAHEDLPFEQLVEALQPERDPSHTPLFQVMFVLQNAPAPKIELPQLSIQILPSERATTKFDLDLTLLQGPAGLHGFFEYNTDLFEATTIMRLARHFQTLLTDAVAHPDRRISELRLLPKPERQQLLEAANGRQSRYPQKTCLHQLFEGHAEQTPDAVAITFDTMTNDERRTTKQESASFARRPSSSVVQLTYRELNRRANRLAHRLHALGVGPEALVGLFVERSLELVVAILGILKAGGAYVPLDPTYPAERIAFMLHDARVAVVLTQAHLRTTLPAVAAPLVCVDDAAATATADDANPASGVTAPNLAYVIYTSGSTGQPKGTLVSHANVARLLAATYGRFDFVADDVWTLFHSYAFDFSVWELWGALAYGGRLVLVPYWVSRTPADCWQLLRRERVTVLNQTPSAFRQLVRAAAATDTRADPALRLVIFGGEALDLRNLRPWFERHGDQRPRLVNMYGITETTVHVTYRSLTSADLKETVGSAIGVPIADLQAYVLDPRTLEPQPLSVPGELYVSGAGLARGYLGRADLTAERFVPNPFGAESRKTKAEEVDSSFVRRPSSSFVRLYKTGDRARYRVDGQLEYLGRLDQQVKLRGFRIELGEIAAVLAEHSDVSDCVVVAHERAGETRLVAYVVPTADEGRTTKDDRRGMLDRAPTMVVPRPASLVSELRSFLIARLPEYMIPSAFVPLAALPLTPQGKIDRRALPDVDDAARESVQPYVAPRNALEAVVAGCWADVLMIERVGIYDNFFELGGHSLLVTQVIARLEEIFPQKLPVWLLFEAPSVAALSAAIAESSRAAGADALLIAELLISLGQISDEAIAAAALHERDDAYNWTRRQGDPSSLAAYRMQPLAPAKRALFARLLQQYGVGVTATPIMPRPPDGRDAPASYSQQRLWFIQQLDPANLAYNIRSAVRFSGPLDLAALEQSLNALIARHEILRTTFVEVAGEPAQHVAPALHLSLAVSDLRALPADEREAHALQLANAEVYQPFDLLRGPLLRASLLRLADAEYVFLLTMHHIISDAWSIPIVAHELGHLYQAARQGQPATLPELSMQYADFAHWQREIVQGERIERQLHYWKEQLAGAPEVLTLPTDRPRPPVQTTHGAAETFALPEILSHELRALGQREGTTLAMTLLAAFQVLLARYAGQTDIVVSMSMANRGRRELEALIGPFYNLLLLRADLSGSPSFRALLGQVRRVALAAYEHQDVPFEKLVEALQPKRDPSYGPLAQVMFLLHNTPAALLELPGVSVAPFGTEKVTTQYDLLLRMREADGQLYGQLEYNTDLFDAATIARMAGHFCALLESSVADPDQPVSALSLLPADERRQLMQLWRGPEAALPSECLPQLFEAQVARTPQAIAVLCGDEHLTYHELNQRANRLAHWLVAQGIGPEVCVGVLAQRTPAFLVVLLAIVKAGGVYLPLDPLHPPMRIAQVLAQSRCPLVLAAADAVPLLRESLASMPSQHPHWSALADLFQLDLPATNLPPRCVLTNLAYVMYTSGSTGMPKVATVEYAGMHNHIQAKTRDLQLSAADTVAQNGPQCFDISIWQLLAALLVGGRVRIIPDAIARDPAELLAQIARDITLVQMVPSMLQALVREIQALGSARPALTALRWVIPTGDALTSELCRAWLRLYPRIPLLNNYGSTECSDDHCHYPIHQAPAPDYRLPILPIGRPIANTLACVLDQHLAPVPIGVVGEFYTGGIAVGRGYLHSPALTAERLVPNPFLATNDEGRTTNDDRAIDNQPVVLRPSSFVRLYKTGDLVRYLPDGSIEFLGRSDARVKIHGLRIDLGEIGAALRRHPAVEEAIALVRADRAGEQRLVAYVVPAEVTNDDAIASSSILRPSSMPSELRVFLKERLPGYMLPAAIVPLDALPLTANGKIDRRTLLASPLPEAAQSGLATDFVAPQTELEIKLARIWSEVLSVPAVSSHANFFDLGGDSFAAVRVVRAFGAGLTLLDVFKYPVLSDLAAHLAVGARQSTGLLQPLLPIKRPPALSLICVPYGGGSAIVYQPLARALPAHYALYALALPGHDFDTGAEDLQPVEEVARRCVEEMQARISGPIALYGHCAGVVITVEIARLLEAAGAQIQAVFLGGALPGTVGTRRVQNFLAKIVRRQHSLDTTELLAYLKSLGGFDEIDDPDELNFVLRSFLHDGRHAYDYFLRRVGRERPRRLSAPIICLMGDRDPLTRNYAKRFKEWEIFSRDVQLAVIAGGDHYFIKHQAEMVAAIIQSTLKV
jgi:amino acid adenylation domain-containing protein